MLPSSFKIAHTAGWVNTTADFLCRVGLKITEEKRLKIQEDIQTTPIVVTTFSSDVAVEEQFFFTQAYYENESAEQPLIEMNNLDKLRSNG